MNKPITNADQYRYHTPRGTPRQAPRTYAEILPPTKAPRVANTQPMDPIQKTSPLINALLKKFDAFLATLHPATPAINQVYCKEEITKLITQFRKDRESILKNTVKKIDLVEMDVVLRTLLKDIEYNFFAEPDDRREIHWPQYLYGAPPTNSTHLPSHKSAETQRTNPETKPDKTPHVKTPGALRRECAYNARKTLYVNWVLDHRENQKPPSNTK